MDKSYIWIWLKEKVVFMEDVKNRVGIERYSDGLSG